MVWSCLLELEFAAGFLGERTKVVRNGHRVVSRGGPLEGNARSMPLRSRAFIFQISSSASCLVTLGACPSLLREPGWRSFRCCFLW